MKKPRETFGTILRAWRTKAKLTPRTAAMQFDVHRSTWFRWEKDEMLPTAEELATVVLTTKINAVRALRAIRGAAA